MLIIGTIIAKGRLVVTNDNIDQYRNYINAFRGIDILANDISYLADLDYINSMVYGISNWDVSNMTNMNDMFYN